MKGNYFLLIVLLFITCNKQLDNYVLGNWELYSVYDYENDELSIYPDTMVHKYVVNFSSDSLTLIGCNIDLGSTKYSIQDDKTLDVEFPKFKLFCGGYWKNSISTVFTYTTTYEVKGDTLILRSTPPNQDITTLYIKG